jgi:small-conductance mechanosensitive channel
MINQVENWSYSSRNVRVQVQVGVGYQTDMALAEQLMLEAAGRARRVLADPKPTVWWSAFGESSVDFTIHCWINDPEDGVGNVRSDVLKNLWGLFREHGIEIPFPQRDINLRDTAEMRALIGAFAAASPR